MIIKSTLIATCLIASSLLPSPARAQESAASRTVEYESGRRGLARSAGYVQGAPLGDVSGWTLSLWFQANSDKGGRLFDLVIEPGNDQSLSLLVEGDELVLLFPAGKSNSREIAPDRPKLQARIGDPSQWHQATITFSPNEGPSLYLDGAFVESGNRRWLDYTASFTNYYIGAQALGDGTFGSYFDGLIDDFMFYGQPLTPEEVAQLFAGEEPSATLLAFNDFENVDHRDLARFGPTVRDDAYLEDGRRLYELNCIACHSKDGKTPSPNPLTRSFTEQPMSNGGDPFSMFKTLTYGYRNMMAAPQLNPVERYKVIHFLREKIIRPNAPQLYVESPDNYTDAMPSIAADLGEEAARFERLAKTGYLRDYGKALVTPVNAKNPMNRTLNGLVIDLGNQTTIGYDLGTMSTIGAWQGGFLDISETLHHKLRASGLPNARFDFIPGMESWRWAWNGKAENSPPKAKPLTIYPESQLRYRGRYAYGDETIISYSVQGRGVLESPIAETQDSLTLIRHRLTIEPSDTAIELIALHVPESSPKIKSGHATITRDGTMHHAWLNASDRLLAWRSTEDGALALRIPASRDPIHIDIALMSAPKSKQFVLNDSPAPVELDKRLSGGPRRWNETHTLKGKLATQSFQGYVFDSLPVPLKNAYNSWMRTTCLAFFPDGRIAVGTLTGDIWIVSGVDDKLQEVTWQRFAAGVYQPMGMKVVDGILTATTRGRLVKFHDYNNDGEADFYEAFHNEPEPADGWHAYSFDLVLDRAGNYYYARVGEYSDWSVPGGLVRVSPDGRRSEVVSDGMRVPNGLGMLPDGRITFSDNQGKWVPASKIAVADTTGAFHGAGGWDKRRLDYAEKAIVEPIIYLPQELDSSSAAQLWVESDPRFGPLGGHFFHTSYGQSRAMIILLDELADTLQGAAYTIPMKMESGTMRLAKNPIDGQLYFAGLTGWQSASTREGSIMRLRHTGEEGLYLIAAKAREGQLLLDFNHPIDSDTLASLKGWRATMWNYRRTSAYGSPKFKVTEPGTAGADDLEITGALLDASGTRLIISVPDLQPCHTLQLDFAVEGKELGAFEGPLYFTIHKLTESESNQRPN